MMRSSTTISAAFISLFLVASAAAADTAPAGSSWSDLKTMFFPNRAIVEDPEIVSLEAPVRAEDAAIVPMTLSAHLPTGDARHVVKLSLIVDENPAPLAGVFTLGEKSEIGAIETRVRVNSYTDVHLVAELSDGSLHMATRYVKAAGGCSAPAAKSAEEASNGLGKMKLRFLSQAEDGRREAVVMLRHPNATGMQMDQITRLYTPARYVDHFAIYQGDDLIFAVEGGISIAEDPNFRFGYRPNGAAAIRAEAKDISGAKYSASWPTVYIGG